MFSSSRLIGTMTAAAAVCIPAPFAVAGVTTVTTLVAEGDLIRGIGVVTSVDAIAVNNNGSWLVEVDTNHPDTEADVLVLRDGVLFAREGQSLDAPPGATLGSFDSVNLNNAGHIGWNLFLDGLAGNEDSGIFFNLDLVTQEGTSPTAPGLSLETLFIGFFEARINDGNSTFVIASVDDPAIPSSVDQVAIWFHQDPESGEVSQSLLYAEGDLIPDTGEAVTSFGTGPENIAINSSGSALIVAALTGDSATNAAIVLDDTLVARKGDIAPGTGLAQNISTSTRVDLNDRGDIVYRTNLSGGPTATNQVIIRNGETFVQKGDDAPGVEGERIIEGFGTGPTLIDNDGEVIWYAELSGDNATDQVLYRGDTIILQKGVTTVDGRTLTTIGGTTATGNITEGFAVSDNGRYIIVRAVLDGDTTAAILVDLGGGETNPADLNGDGFVDGADLGLLLAAWGTPGPGDLDGSGTVDGADLGGILAAWTGS